MSQDLVVDTTSLSQGTVRFPAGDRVAAQNITVGLDTGVLTDYPFDRYTTTVEQSGGSRRIFSSTGRGGSADRYQRGIVVEHRRPGS